MTVCRTIGKSIFVLPNVHDEPRPFRAVGAGGWLALRENRIAGSEDIVAWEKNWRALSSAGFCFFPVFFRRLSRIIVDEISDALSDCFRLGGHKKGVSLDAISSGQIQEAAVNNLTVGFRVAVKLLEFQRKREHTPSATSSFW